MLDAVERSCLYHTNSPEDSHYVKLTDDLGEIVTAYSSSAAMRHALWLEAPGARPGGEARNRAANLCRCQVKALRDALNAFLAVPVDKALACERWSPEFREWLREFEAKAPAISDQSEAAWEWANNADAVQAAKLAEPGMLMPEDPATV